MAASSAGAEFGYQLLWAVAFSVFATIVLQQMAARLGIATGTGLSESLRSSIANTALRVCALGLVLVAIFIGNSAYQTGNILGAATGLLSAFSATEVDGSKFWFDQNVAVVVVAALALLVIWIGRFDVLQGLLTILVVLMSLLFVVAAIRSGPDWSQVLSGFKPRVPTGADWIVIGLVGTTVVPYNLFLHASAAAQQWGDDGQQAADGSTDERKSKAMAHSRWDTVFSVLVGGLITCAILITASAAFHGEENSAKLGKVADVAKQLEPALGLWAKRMFALGLLAAGLTSAITAPIAAAFAAAGCFGWTGKLSDWRLKVVASIVVIAGAVFAIQLGNSPKETIILAQVANGLLLPIIAVCLLLMTNDGRLMGNFKNGRVSNVFAIVVILIVSVIALNQFRKVSEKLKPMWQTKTPDAAYFFSGSGLPNISVAHGSDEPPRDSGRFLDTASSVKGASIPLRV